MPYSLSEDYTCHGNGIADGNGNQAIADCRRQMQYGNRRQYTAKFLAQNHDFMDGKW